MRLSSQRPHLRLLTTYLVGICAAPEAGTAAGAGTALAASPETGATTAFSSTLPPVAGRKLPK